MIFSPNILLQGSFNLMKQFKMPFRNVQKRTSVNGKAKLKKNKTSLQRKDLVWIKLEVTPKLDSSNNQMKVIQQKDEYLLCRQTVFRFEGLHKVAQVHSCFHNMMRTNCILLVCHFVFLRSLTVSFVGVIFVSWMLVWRLLSCSYFIFRCANTITTGSYLSTRSGVNKD